MIESILKEERKSKSRQKRNLSGKEIEGKNQSLSSFFGFPLGSLLTKLLKVDVAEFWEKGVASGGKTPLFGKEHLTSQERPTQDLKQPTGRAGQIDD